PLALLRKLLESNEVTPQPPLLQTRQSLISPFLPLHHPPVQLQISLPTGPVVQPILPSFSTSLAPPPEICIVMMVCALLHAVSLLQTGLLMFEIKSQAIF
uniref:Uncharacterized protein n=1 Tax=Ficedula albicollis TaxID=59894 RepID=A0A803V163_FICAL